MSYWHRKKIDFSKRAKRTRRKGHLLDDLISRGLSVEKEYLFFIDGAKALRKGITARFGSDVAVQRCQKHKRKNVKDHLPKKYHSQVDRRLSVAWKARKYEDAGAELEQTAKWLEGISESAARSLREGLEETLTVTRLALPEALRTSLRTTNMVESCFSKVRTVTNRVKRWRSGNQVARWAAAGLLESEKGFRRVRGHRSMSVLKVKLQQYKENRQEASKERKSLDAGKAIA